MLFSSDHPPTFCIWGMYLVVYLQGVCFSLEGEGFYGGLFFFLRKLVLWNLLKLSNGRDRRKCKYL